MNITKKELSKNLTELIRLGLVKINEEGKFELTEKTLKRLED